MNTKAASANQAALKSIIGKKITVDVEGTTIELRRPRRSEIVETRNNLISIKDEITDEQNIELAIEEVENVVYLCVPGLARVCLYTEQAEAEQVALEHEGTAVDLNADAPEEDARSVWSVMRENKDGTQVYLFSDGSFRDDPYESEAFNLIMAAGGEQSELVQMCFRLCGMAPREVDALAQEDPTTS